MTFCILKKLKIKFNNSNISSIVDLMSVKILESTKKIPSTAMHCRYNFVQNHHHLPFDDAADSHIMLETDDDGTLMQNEPADIIT